MNIFQNKKKINSEDYYYNKNGLATYYGKDLHNIRTANNEFNKQKLFFIQMDWYNIKVYEFLRIKFNFLIRKVSQNISLLKYYTNKLKNKWSLM